MSPQDELRSLPDRLPDRERGAITGFASQLVGSHQARADLIQALNSMTTSRSTNPYGGVWNAEAN
jgi:hypothetical protein